MKTPWFKPSFSMFAVLFFSGFMSTCKAFAETNTCTFFPIAISAQTLVGVTPNTVIKDILNGSQPGNFGWLTWSGSPSEPTLVASLTLPGNSSTYTNPDNPNDHLISIGDWISGKPGVSSSKDINKALTALTSCDIVIPIWDQARKQGSNAAYHISGFARISIVGFSLPGQNKISARFLGYFSCGGQNQAPVVNAGGDQSVLFSQPAYLNGTVTDDNLPMNASVQTSWSMVSGPGSVAFANSNALITTATFSAPGIFTLRLTATDTELANSDDLVVTVNLPNQPPVADPQSVTTSEDVPVAITLTGRDPELAPILFSVVTAPNHGSLTGTPPNLIYQPAPDFNGSDAFTFRVNDGQLDSPSATVTISITPVNDQPVADSISLTNQEDTAVQVVLSGADVEGSSLTYLIVGAPSFGTLGTILSNTVTYTPFSNFNGTDQFQYVSNDGALNSATTTVSLVFLPVNDAPALSQLPDVTLDEQTALAVTATATDADQPANTLTYSLTAAPQGMTIDPATGTISWTPSEAQGPSVNTVTVTVSDSDTPSLSDTKSFTVTVKEVNAAPVLSQLADVTLDEQTALSVTATATDADQPANTLTYSLTAAPAGMTIDPATGAISWTPTEAQGPSVNTVTVMATDSGTPSLSDSKSFTLTVKEVNVAPVLSQLADVTINEQTALSLIASATDGDQPANTLTYSLTASPTGMTIDPATGAIAWTPTEAQGPSVNTVTVTVTDSATPSLSDTKSFTVTVKEVNTAPALAALPDVTLDEQTPMSATAMATDADQPANTLTYSLAAAPTGMTIDPATGAIIWTPTEAQGPSVNTVTVTVTDNGTPTLSDTKSFTVTVKEVNAVPVLSALPDVTLDELTALSVTATATDADQPANTLTYSLATSPAGMTIDPATGVISWTPTEAQGPSVNTVTVTVADNGTPALSDAKSFTVTVKEVNTAPVLAVLPDVALDEQTALSVTATATDADQPANTLTYSLAAAPQGMTIDPATGTISWTPSEAQGPSVNTVTVTVADNGTPALSDAKSFTVTVKEVNTAPALSPLPDVTIDEQTAFSVTAIATDIDQPANTLTYSLAAAPTGMTVDPATGAIIWTPTEAQGPSVNAVTVTVTDNGTPALADTKSFTMTVKEVNTAPVLSQLSDVTLDELTALSVTATATDADQPANTLTYSLATAPTGITIDPATGAISWTPTEAQGPSVNTVTVTVSDNGTPSLFDAKSFTVTVRDVNNAPIAQNQSLTTTEDQAISGTLHGIDSDNDTLTYSLIAQGTKGTTVLNSDNTFTYTPFADMKGSDTFTFIVHDGKTNSEPATVTVTITGVNDAPTVQNQSLVAVENTPFLITLNGSDIENDPLTFAIVAQPAHGTLSPLNNAGAFTYTPGTNYFGSDVFTFTANDGQAASAEGQITINVSPRARSRTFTTDEDFSEGQFFKALLVSNDEVAMRSASEAFNNIWVAVSTKGTIVRIDTDTGEIKGEYRTAPEGQPLDPSRTTVDMNGSVWAANRAGNSLVHVAVPQTDLWVDRNGNGVLDTSTGLGDVRPWPNTAGADTDGGTATAQDELILHYVKVSALGTRHVSVNASNDVWVSGTGGRSWDLLDGDTGQIIRHEPSVGIGGYGGLIDRTGVIWSASGMLRWDTSKPLTGPEGANWQRLPDVYGLGLDSKGNVWGSTLYNGKVLKFAPNGTLLGTFNQGAANAQGVAVDLNDDVWIAHSLLGGNTVGHLKNDGTWIGNVKVGEGPTGVAVDVKGKVWVTNYRSGNVMRIDPTLGPLGADGITPVGEVDYISPYLGGCLYNYSDMTGSTLNGFPGQATWTVIYDGTIPQTQWGAVAWNSKIYDDGKLQVSFSTSDDGISFGPEEELSQPGTVPLSVGRYAKVKILFVRSTAGKGPVLEDLTLGTVGYDAPVIQPVLSVDAGADRDLQLPLAAVLTAAIRHNGFYLYTTNQSFNWSQVSGPGSVDFSSPAAVVTKARISERGEYVLRVETEMFGTNYSDEVTINAIPINRSPWVYVGENRALRFTNEVLHVVAEARDDGLPEGSALTLRWSKVIGPGTVEFSAPTSVATDIRFSAPGIYILQLAGTDGDLTYTDRMEVRVQAVSDVPSPSGMIQWWPGNADTLEWVRGNDLYLLNGTSYTNAQVAYGFFFNGTTNYAKAFEHSTTDIGAGDALSFECWIKPASSGRLLEWNSNGTRGLYVDYNTWYDTVIFHLVDTAGVDHPWSVQSALNRTAFYHLAFVYDKATGDATVYINGAVFAKTNLGVFTPRTKGDIYFAGSATETARFGGILDEISFYKRALNGQEIQAIWSASFAGRYPNDNNLPPVVDAGTNQVLRDTGSLVLCGTASDDAQPAGVSLYSQWRMLSGPAQVDFQDAANPATSAYFPVSGIYVLELYADDAVKASRDTVEVRVDTIHKIQNPPGLAAWWPGNNSSIDLVDGKYASLVNGTDYAQGYVSSCFSFDGINDYVWMSAQTNYNIGTSASGFSLEFWIKPGVMQDGTVLGWPGGVRVERFPQVWYGAGLRCLLGAGGQVVQTRDPVWEYTTFTWAHVAVTYDRDSRLGKLYINGVLVSSGDMGTNLLSTASDFYLGQVPGSWGIYKGGLDEVSLYRGVLDPEQVYALYAAGTIGKQPLDGNAAPAVYAGADQIVTGVPGTAMLFGEALDDGLPQNTSLRLRWSVLSGPGTVTFSDPSSLLSTAVFSTNGLYVLQLSADDGEAQSLDRVEVRVETLYTLQGPDGLAAWWPANGWDSEVVNNYDSLLGSGVGYAPGQVAQAFSFDGINDYVWMSAQTNYNIGTSASGFSLDFWIKPGVMQDGTVLGWPGGVRVERFPQVWYGAGLRCLLGAGGQVVQTRDPVWEYTTFTWVHVAVTYDRASRLGKLYINGVLVSSGDMGTNLLSTASDFYLGQVPGSWGIYKGGLDEVSLYRGVLDPEQVYALYTAGTIGKQPLDGNEAPFVYAGADQIVTGVPGIAMLLGEALDDGLPQNTSLRTRWSVLSGPGAVTFSDPLSPLSSAVFSTNGLYVLQLSADDGEAQSLDRVEVRVETLYTLQGPDGLAAWWPANGWDSEVVNNYESILGSGVGYAPGQVAQAFSFDGINDYVWMSAQTNYNIGTSASGFSLEFWIKPGTMQDGSVLGWPGGVRVERFPQVWYGAGLRCLLGAGGQVVQTRDPVWEYTTFTWAHVAVTYDRDSHLGKLYINGVLVSSGDMGTNLLITASDFYLGQVPGSAGIYKGGLDEVSLYRGVLDPEQVYALYTAGTIGKQPLDGNVAPVVYAGPDIILSGISDVATLHGLVMDDGMPTSSVLRVCWSQYAGPGVAFFTASNAPETAVSFSTNGLYILKLMADDGEDLSSDLMEVRVGLSNSVNDPSGLVAWWPGNGTPIEKIGGKYGILCNGSTFAQGKVATSFAFDGINDNVWMPAQTNYNIGTSASGFSLEFWIKPGVMQDGTVLGWPGGVRVERFPQVWYGAGLRCLLGAGGQVVQTRDPVWEYTTFTWAHVAVTYDRDSRLGKLYINEVLVSSGDMGTNLLSTASDFYLGQVPGSWGIYKGGLDEVSLYNRPLTQSEIHAIYVAGSAGKDVLPRNQPPVVQAGIDKTIYLSKDTGLATVTLSGFVYDDGLPASNTLSSTWTYVNGAFDVYFSSTNTPVTSITFTNTGVYTFALSGNDGEFTVTDTATVTVQPDPRQPPSIIITSPADGTGIPVQEGESASFTLTTTSADPDGLVTQVAFFQNGNPVSLLTHAPYSLTLTSVAPGTYTYTAVATDNSGLSVASTPVRVTVFVNENGPYPTLAITSPAHGDTVTAPTNIMGTVYGGGVVSYTLQIRSRATGMETEADWQTLATGAAPVGFPGAPAVLGTLDPTLLRNGAYELRVNAEDQAGATYSVDGHAVILGGGMKIGQFQLSFEDLNIPLVGIPLQLLRSYDSRGTSGSDFGPDWELGFRSVQVQASGPVGAGWEDYVKFVDVNNFSHYSIRPIRRQVVSVVVGDEVQQFEAYSPTVQGMFPLDAASVAFRPINASVGSLVTKKAFGNLTVERDGYGVVTLLDFETIDVLDPQEWVYKTEDGTRLEITRVFGLSKLTDRNSNSLTFTRDGIMHSSGESVAFTRDTEGRITDITAPGGVALKYAYDEHGYLASFVNRAGGTNTFEYIEHPAAPSRRLLQTIIDPLGNRALAAGYDDDGRLISQADATGRAVTFDNDFPRRRQSITDRLGNVTVHEYDIRGNIVRTIDPLGHATLRAYDEYDNEIRLTNPLGSSKTYTYDSKRNKLSETDPLGNITRYVYDAYAHPLTNTDARGYATVFIYDESGNLAEDRDPLGNVTRFTYDAAGNLLTRTDALGNVTENGYDGLGHVIRTVKKDSSGNVVHRELFTYDARGNKVETRLVMTETPLLVLTNRFEYDAENRLVKTTLPDGSITRTSYNALGKEASQTDELGRVKTYTYDERGNRVRTSYSDGTFEETAYDAENRKVAETNRLGRKTEYQYDPLGRLTRTVFPDGTAEVSVYDALGRVAASTDARGNITEYEYVPGSFCSTRRSKVTDALGNQTLFTYDANRNLLSATDANGRTTRYVYDANNRQTAVIFHDGTTKLTEYDALGRRTAETDQDEKTTAYVSDALGRLIAVTNALGHVTTYEYDMADNLNAQTDANGHTTRFAYDFMGRRISRVLPGGQIETYAYDAAGNMTSKTDFNGKTTTYAYDSANRLIAKIPDASFNDPGVAFTYSVTGMRLTMSDASGVTAYSYDDRGRLTEKAGPVGTLRYGYDAHGNLTNICSIASGGVSLAYAYDALNRLQSVTDARTGTTAYEYDAVGNLAGYVYPNGVAVLHDFDALNRLTRLTGLNAQSAVIADYGYTLGPSGHRMTAVEAVSATGGVRTISRVYSYDASSRLLGETLSVSGIPSLPPTAAVSYTLDAVGNRLARSSTLPGVLSDTDTFDENDRLEDDSYDANGNTLEGLDSSRVTLGCVYDFEDRLIAATTASGASVSIVYDGDGNRVAKTVNGVTTFYLVDDRNPTGYAQVLEEHVAMSAQQPVMSRVYTYGLDLVSQDQLLEDGQGGWAWSASFYGYDGHGNVRYLTDASDSITDTYDYDAFGTLIAQFGNTPNTYLYCGEQWDADLGLSYNRARYLNTNSGRFWTQDVYEGVSNDPASLHKYLYAGAAPIMFVDSSGFMYTIGELMVATGIDAEIRKISEGFKAQAMQRAKKKLGCEVAKAATIQGIYILVLPGGDLYVGQSVDIWRRYAEHRRTIDKAGAQIVGMLKVATGIDQDRAAKYVREIIEAFFIEELKPKKNIVRNPVRNPNRLTKYRDPVQAGVDKLFEVVPLCKDI
jgi:RHS repeat-associated protein